MIPAGLANLLLGYYDDFLIVRQLLRLSANVTYGNLMPEFYSCRLQMVIFDLVECGNNHIYV